MDASKLPEWKCHKVVRAARISAVLIDKESENHPDCVRTLTFDDTTETWAAHVMNKCWSRFIPAVGDYLVAYEDGYVSFSPAKAFEDGYTRNG